MEKKLIPIWVVMLLIGITSFQTTVSIHCNIAEERDIVHNYSEIPDEIEQEIGKISDKTLCYENNIGNITVLYWEHTINDVSVKGDSILLHINSGNNEVLNYKKSWTDSIVFDDAAFQNNVFETDEIFWKKLIVFPEENDSGNFYSFYERQKYPVVCWEVRHTDGTTILYNFNGIAIGKGIPTPTKGFSLSGYNDPSWPDAWIEYRENADDWFKVWCSTTVSISLPSPSTISSHISDPTTAFFYQLAHGDELYFQADAQGSNYYASTLHNDMQNRQPMKFAFLGSCHGMTATGPGTFSYEFRKGQMINTVTVGFDHMETCPGWEFGWYWQNSLLENMSKGLTIKESFDLATAQYPTIEPAVVFLGDENLVAMLLPNLECDGELMWDNVNPGSEITGEFTIANAGEEGSMLDWEITEYPSEWGTWAFSQEEGEDVTPADGAQTIQVTVIAPDEKNAVFSGEIKVVNRYNADDYDTIQISCTTPKNKVLPGLFKYFVYSFPILRYILKL